MELLESMKLGCPLFEYFLTEYSNNIFLLNKPYKNVNFQTIFPKKNTKKNKNIEKSNLVIC
jgi:hypothetical protein